MTITTGRAHVTAKIETPLQTVADMTDDPIVLGLKRLYDSVLEEDVPDDFMNLLGQIDATLAKIGDDHGPEDSGNGENSATGLSS
jgi:Anti-sigma factor NepR